MRNFFIIFVILFIFKITNLIAWSWWLVTLPLYFVPGILAGFVFLIACCVCIQKIFE
jgi:hypothetical protein